MKRENYNDLYAFLQVAEAKSFAKAAAKLAVSPPALSKTIRLLEQRLGVQLFHRTTRSVSLTQAGLQLFYTAQASFARLDNELSLIEHYRSTPSGLVRINCGLHVIDTLLLPKLAHFSTQYPEIQLEFISENRFIDIVAEGFDAGIRFDDNVAQDMIAKQISEPMPMAVVASPDYFQKNGFPKTPKDLENHQCIAYRLNGGGLFSWKLGDGNETIEITPRGQWILNDDHPTKIAAKMGLGIAYLPKELVKDELNSGELIQIFKQQSPSLPALYLYYPSRNISPALRVVVDTLKI
ncbi:LysR family transcriptional regulator [Testudinibacter sp. P27/CKL/0425]